MGQYGSISHKGGLKFRCTADSAGKDLIFRVTKFFTDSNQIGCIIHSHSFRKFSTEVKKETAGFPSYSYLKGYEVLYGASSSSRG